MRSNSLSSSAPTQTPLLVQSSESTKTSREQIGVAFPDLAKSEAVLLLPLEVLQKWKKNFDFADADSDGKLTFSEFKILLQRIGYTTWPFDSSSSTAHRDRTPSDLSKGKGRAIPLVKKPSKRDLKSTKIEKGIEGERKDDVEEEEEWVVFEECVWYTDVLADFLFKGFDGGKLGFVTFSDFVVATAIMLNGTNEEKLQLSFRMIDRTQRGYIAEDDISQILLCFAQVISSMGIRLQEDSAALISHEIFSRLCTANDKRVPQKMYVENASKCLQVLKRLASFYSLPLSGRLPSQERVCHIGTAVSFGHPYFNLMFSMLLGVRLTGQAIADSSFTTEDVVQTDYQGKRRIVLPTGFSPAGDLEKPQNPMQSYYFGEFAPLVFYHMRRLGGVDEVHYMQSLGPEQMFGNMFLGNLSTLRMKVSDGKSGSFFFISSDASYFVKTISPFEKMTLKRILPRLHRHFQEFPETLINRIYGFYQMKPSARSLALNFIVIENIFLSSEKIDECYDLKGSLKGRSAGPGATVKKDVDFLQSRECIYLPEESRELLITQIENDVKLLESLELIDYSLLVGISRRKTSVDSKSELEGKDRPLQIPKRGAVRFSTLRGVVPFHREDAGGMQVWSNLNVGGYFCII